MLVSYRCPESQKGERTRARHGTFHHGASVIDAFVLVSKGNRLTLLCAKQPVRFRRKCFFLFHFLERDQHKARLSTTSAICFRRPQRQNLLPRQNHVCNISLLWFYVHGDRLTIIARQILRKPPQVNGLFGLVAVFQCGTRGMA